MLTRLVEIFHEQPALVLFLVLGLGYFMGKIRVRGFELGSAAGVLFAGLFFGHFGFTIPRLFQTFGFILFIYSVGFQVGPQFFRISGRKGAKFMLLALVVGGSGFLTAVLFTLLFDFEEGVSAGLLAGALTSTPTLAAAQDVIQTGQAVIPDGMTESEVLSNISTSYAITYIFGLAGLLIFIRLFPRWIGINLPDEAKKVADKLMAPVSDHVEDRPSSQFAMRTFRVLRLTNPDAAGKTVKEMESGPGVSYAIRRIKRGDTIYIPQPDDALRKEDLILVGGQIDSVLRLSGMIGPEVSERDLMSFEGETCEIVVTNPGVVGKKIGELDLQATRGCVVQRYTRMGIEIPLSMEMTIEKGDVIRVHGHPKDLEKMTRQFGHAERQFHETDLFTFAFGIAAGIFIGTFAVKVGGIPIGLGMAGGLLLAGLVLGYLRSINPTFGRVPAAARWIFMELGLMLFMAGVGMNAGAGILAALEEVGLSVFLSGAGVTLVPVIAGYTFGRFVLKVNPALLLGGITGSMTSTAALNIVSEEAKSPLPALGYTAAYAFANVFLTVAGSLIMRL